MLDYVYLKEKKAGRKRFKVTASGAHAKRLSLKSVSNTVVIFGGGKSTLHYLTLRRLMSYIYGAPILDVSRSHTTTQHSR